MSNDDDGGKNKKAALIGVSSLFLVAMVVAVAVGVNRNDPDEISSTSGDGGTTEISTSVKAIKALCQPTDYQETCIESLSGVNTSDPRELIKVGFQSTINELKSAIVKSATLKEFASDPKAKPALDVCNEVVEYAIDDLIMSFDRITDNFNINKITDYVEDLKVWLSATLTLQDTCVDAFDNVTGDTGDKMRQLLKTSKEMTANGLGMVSEVTSIMSSFGMRLAGRRLLEEESNKEEEEPSWINDRRGLLQATPKTIQPNVVVAKDGSGKYKTVNEALFDIPKKSNKTFVIYVKEGVYEEQVMMNKSMTWVMMIGDGPNKTKITSNKNFADGTPTFKTATVAVVGTNFIAKDMWFENSAGPEKHQAVALRVQSDMSIFYNCQMDGYQDTLYTHTHRQFYRDCTITGTIDFIFGNAAVVFQNCKIFVRKPLPNQQCIVTAQGRSQRKEPTAIILQNCLISSAPDYFPVRHTYKAYLGRPWKQYSRTIILQCKIDDLIQPEGWLPWTGDFALNTLFYSEYNCRGAGSKKDNRVKWRGIKEITPEHAIDFTAGLFIRGNPWIKPTGVPYSSGMMTLSEQKLTM
ncbi:pectinesterase-like [Cucurbita moschata]|uniref:Pectinesterase n=1 Tax=Cucurbita moschata TaxID=3662 RepID=A0A6J1GYH5_CUCMO|nr:pectinesterase-like [Cucurbita moschata]